MEGSEEGNFVETLTLATSWGRHLTGGSVMCWSRSVDPSSPLRPKTPSRWLEISHSLSTYITKSANATNQTIIFSWKAHCQNINHTKPHGSPTIIYFKMKTLRFREVK